MTEKEHEPIGNEVVPGGIVHKCSCGWVSRPCFSNAIASIEGRMHRQEAVFLDEDDTDG